MSEELESRLRRKVQVLPMTGGGSLNGRAYITDDGKRLANPDGPEAADTLRRYREALAQIATCENSINGRIARAALEDCIDG